MESWWLLPIVSGAESGESGQSGIERALRKAFGPIPDLRHAALMSGGLAPTAAPRLSDSDSEILREVNRQAANIFTQLNSVVERRTNAFFIWGPGGHGKSYLVRLGLSKCDHVKWTTTDVSAKGLFNLLRDFPTHIHVFEDMEKMYKQADCQAVLRAACGGQSLKERIVCWEKEGASREAPFEFAGGIVVISNEDPKGKSLKMGAIASRFAPQEWKLTEPELAAMIRDVAIRTKCVFGLTVEERQEVAEYVIEQMAKRPTGIFVDLRTYCEHALPAYVQWKEGKSGVPWQEVVTAKIKGGPRRDYAEVQRERLLEAACEAYFAGSDKETRVAAWKAKTGLSASQFYEYLKEAKEDGIFTEYESRESPD